MKKGTVIELNSVTLKNKIRLVCGETPDKYDYYLKFWEYDFRSGKCLNPITVLRDADYKIVGHVNPARLTQ